MLLLLVLWGLQRGERLGSGVCLAQHRSIPTNPEWQTKFHGLEFIAEGQQGQGQGQGQGKGQGKG